jgi:glycosyltransferase involved in cell wall biosynthesis
VGPTVSVILPVRNCADTVAEAVESILAQTYDDFELLLIDDHSTDGTAEAAPRDARLKTIPNPGNGLVDALNAGLERARGEFIARMDGDDVSLPERFERQIEVVKADEKLGVVGCGVSLMCPSGTDAPGMRRYVDWLNSVTEPGEIERQRYVESPIAHPSAFGRREAFALGYRDCGWPEDYDLWLRMLRAGWRIGKAPQTLLRWRDDAGRLSRTHSRYSPAAFRACKLHHLSREFDLAARPLYLWGVGRTGKPWLRFLIANGFTPALAVDLHPRRIGTPVHGVPVVHPLDFLERVRPDDGLSLIAVAEPSALPEIQAMLDSHGFVEGAHYLRIA